MAVDVQVDAVHLCNVVYRTWSVFWVVRSSLSDAGWWYCRIDRAGWKDARDCSSRSLHLSFAYRNLHRNVHVYPCRGSCCPNISCRCADVDAAAVGAQAHEFHPQGGSPRFLSVPATLQDAAWNTRPRNGNDDNGVVLSSQKQSKQSKQHKQHKPCKPCKPCKPKRAASSSF